MTTIDTIRTRMRDLADEARRALRLHDAGAIGRDECLAMAAEMQRFMIETTTGLLDLSDRAAAIGDRRGAEELFGLAMEIEEHLLRDAPPIEVGRPAGPPPRLASRPGRGRAAPAGRRPRVRPAG